jgi:hypothetical protein
MVYSFVIAVKNWIGLGADVSFGRTLVMNAKRDAAWQEAREAQDLCRLFGCAHDGAWVVFVNLRIGVGNGYSYFEDGTLFYGLYPPNDYVPRGEPDDSACVLSACADCGLHFWHEPLVHFVRSLPPSGRGFSRVSNRIVRERRPDLRGDMPNNFRIDYDNVDAVPDLCFLRPALTWKRLVDHLAVCTGLLPPLMAVVFEYAHLQTSPVINVLGGGGPRWDGSAQVQPIAAPHDLPQANSHRLTLLPPPPAPPPADPDDDSDDGGDMGLGLF